MRISDWSSDVCSSDLWLATANGRGCPASDPLLRAMHTISGAFAMTEFPAISEVTGPMESYIKRLLAHNRFASAQGFALIAQSDRTSFASAKCVSVRLYLCVCLFLYKVIFICLH